MATRFEPLPLGGRRWRRPGLLAVALAVAACGAFSGSPPDVVPPDDAGGGDATTSDASADAGTSSDASGSDATTDAGDATPLRFCDSMRDAFACWDFDGIDQQAFTYFEMSGGAHLLAPSDASAPNAMRITLYEGGLGAAEEAISPNEAMSGTRARLNVNVKLLERLSPTTGIGIVVLTAANGTGPYVYLGDNQLGTGYFAKSGAAGDQAFGQNVIFQFVTGEWFHLTMTVDWSDAGAGTLVTASMGGVTTSDLILGLTQPITIKLGAYLGGNNGQTSVLFDNVVLNPN